MRFLVRREYVLEDTLRTVKWPNFCVYDRIVVSFFSFCMWFNIHVHVYRYRPIHWDSTEPPRFSYVMTISS